MHFYCPTCASHVEVLPQRPRGTVLLGDPVAMVEAWCCQAHLKPVRMERYEES